jgi:hypothetical protein
MDYYEKKYFKYKNKYLIAKNQMGGSNHPACSIIRQKISFPTLVIKDRTGFFYYDAKYNSSTKHYTGKWCSNPNMGEWNLDENIIVAKQMINDNASLLKLCSCN